MIHKYSSKYSVDPVLLMQEITKIDKVNVKESDLDKLASELEKEENLYSKYQIPNNKNENIGIWNLVLGI